MFHFLKFLVPFKTLYKSLMNNLLLYFILLVGAISVFTFFSLFILVFHSLAPANRANFNCIVKDCDFFFNMEKKLCSIKEVFSLVPFFPCL